MKFVVAIDGTAASGKGTLGKKIAEQKRVKKKEPTTTTTTKKESCSKIQIIL